MAKTRKTAPAPSRELAAPAREGSLDAEQRRLLAEALRRAEEARNVIEDTLVAFGRWVLVAVFDDDAGEALSGKSKNPVWSELLRRAGGPTLRLSERLLYVSVHIAAYDRRITDEAWRNLEPGRKELLLPLQEETLLREGAQHVTAMKLSQRATKTYVAGVLAAQGRPKEARLTPGRLRDQVKGFRERVTGASWRRRAVSAMRHASPEERKALREELLAVQRWTRMVLGSLRRKES